MQYVWHPCNIQICPDIIIDFFYLWYILFMRIDGDFFNE